MPEDFKDITFKLSESDSERPDPEKAPNEWNMHWKASAVLLDEWVRIADDILLKDTQLRFELKLKGRNFVTVRCTIADLQLWAQRIQEFSTAANERYREYLAQEAQRQVEEEQQRTTLRKAIDELGL